MEDQTRSGGIVLVYSLDLNLHSTLAPVAPCVSRLCAMSCAVFLIRFLTGFFTLKSLKFYCTPMDLNALANLPLAVIEESSVLLSI